jgi:hypothetical protein
MTPGISDADDSAMMMSDVDDSDEGEYEEEEAEEGDDEEDEGECEGREGSSSAADEEEKFVDVSDSFWAFVKLVATEPESRWQVNDDGVYARMREAALGDLPLALRPGHPCVPAMRPWGAGAWSSSRVACVPSLGAYMFVDADALFYDAGSLLCEEADRDLLQSCIDAISRHLELREAVEGITQGLFGKMAM